LPNQSKPQPPPQLSPYQELMLVVERRRAEAAESAAKKTTGSRGFILVRARKGKITLCNTLCNSGLQV
jgi:hypothetical protein